MSDRHTRRGLTLLELCFVVMILGVLIAITVPTCDVILRRSHQAEARSMLSASAHAQHDRDTGTDLACPASGERPHPTVRFPSAGC
ncbi:MAG: prepilin-type N-terminal cleavage/methylation domain-containing protein [Myxococcota bacterium]|nr:prepilin-type N-terminal cleavage/methylation domain-containing protein [Myxococcota bacterium]